MNMADEAKPRSAICSTSEALVCDMQSSIVMGKNRALSVDQCRLQVLQFLVHDTDFLNILLRCNGFAKIQKAIVDQMGSRPPNSDHDPSFGVSLTLGSALELLLGPTPELIIAGCHMQSIFIAHHNLIEKWFTAL